MTMTIEQFCDRRNACKEGRAWALETGAKDMFALWMRVDLCNDWRVWIARQPGVLSDRELRLFACWCIRQVWPLLSDVRSRRVVEVAELFAEGKATREELSAAYAAAYDAAYAAAYAADSAADSAAYAAASAAAYAADSAAYAAVYAAASAAYAAASAAASAAAREAQNKWLIENTKPNFEET